MTFVTEIRKSVAEATPVFAVVGATDLAAEKVRDARSQVLAARKTITSVDPKAVQKDVATNAEKALKSVQDVPATVLERTLELAGSAQHRYDALARRGERLVTRIRTQQATQDLVSQAGQTVSAGRGAVTTVRKAVSNTQSSARGTVTTGRRQATRVAHVVSDVARREAKEVADSAAVVADATADARKATTSAAKRTRTTARKGAQATTSRAKATTTSARKSAPRARKAASDAAKKVGK
jgi:heparin binding hemagglutinin HbhA